MAQVNSNVVPAAQQALFNAKNQNYSSLASPNVSYASLAPANKSYGSLSSQIPMATSVSTGQPVAGSITTLKSAPTIGGAVNPRTIQPLASATIGQPGGTNALGTHILTQAELDAQNAKNGVSQFNTGTATVGGSVGSSNSQTGGTTPPPLPPNTGTDNTYSATNPPTSQAGLIGSALGQAQGYYNQQQGLTTQAQAVQKAIADMQSRIGQEQAATTGQYNGTASDEAGRIAQLEQIKQSTAANMGQQAATIQQEQATQAGYESPLTSTYGTAINASSPTGNYPFVFNPLTQSFTNAGGGAVLTSQQAARDVISGKTSYDQAKTALGYMGQTGEAQLQSAITAAGGDPLKLQAQGAATQSNIQTGGTAATSAAATGLQQSTNAYVSANTAYTTAQNQAGNLQQTMAATGINTNPQFVNSKINTLQNQMGSDKYVSFVTALSEAQQAYTSLLASVGAATPTVNGQQAITIFNPDSTPAQINAAIDALNQAAYAKLKPMYDQIQTYSSQLGGGGTSGSSLGSSSGAFSDSSFYGNK